MTPLIAALLLLLPPVLWVFYLAYVTLIVAKKNGRLAKSPRVVRAYAYVILLVAGALDLVFNVIFGSLIFLEPPRELMFTTRCERHMRKNDWRGERARWFCEGWLNPFDEDHCH